MLLPNEIPWIEKIIIISRKLNRLSKDIISRNKEHTESKHMTVKIK